MITPMKSKRTNAVATDHDEKIQKKNSLIHFPNEIWMKIFEYLTDPNDRINFAEADEQFNRLIRRFSRIEFTSVNGADLDVTFFDEQTPSECQASPSFFKHATVEKLIINGQLSKKGENRLKTAMKSLMFLTVDVEILNDRSFMFLIELAQKTKYLKEISFRWKIRDSDASKEMLLCLPQSNGYNICVSNDMMLIDNEILLHLISSCENSLTINSIWTCITVTGLAKAFEMMCAHDERKLIAFCVENKTFLDFWKNASEKLAREQKGTRSTVVHPESGAVMLCSSNDAHTVPIMIASAKSVPDLTDFERAFLANYHEL